MPQLSHRPLKTTSSGDEIMNHEHIRQKAFDLCIAWSGRARALFGTAQCLPSGCWTRSSGIPQNFYPCLWISGRVAHGHRVALELYTGANLSGLEACHRCDNKWCINPTHLFWGARSENMRDCASKGRSKIPYAKGSASGMAKLSEESAAAIRASYGPSCSTYKLARDYGVTRRTIANILQRKTWNHVA